MIYTIILLCNYRLRSNSAQIVTLMLGAHNMIKAAISSTSNASNEILFKG